MKIRTSKQRLSGIIIALLPVLNMYKVGFIFNGLAEWLCVIVSGLILISPSKDTAQIHLEERRYFRRNIACILILIFSSLFNIDVGFNYRNLIFIFIVLIGIWGCYSNRVHLGVLCKTYIVIASLASIYIILQVLFMSIFHVFLPAKILPLPTTDIFDAISEYNRLGYFRAQSFFSEPSTYAQYVIPAYCLILFKQDKKYIDKVRLVLMTVGMVISTSSMGIISIGLLWSFYSWEFYRKDIPRILLYSVIAIAVLAIFINSNEYIRRSINSILFSASSSGKTTTRILRGFAVYGELPLVNKIVGVGLGNGDAYISRYSITTAFESVWGTQIVEYFNNIAASLIYGGIFGGFFFILTQLSFLTTTRKAARALSITFLIISVASFMFFNVIYLLFAAVLISAEKYDDALTL